MNELAKQGVEEQQNEIALQNTAMSNVVYNSDLQHYNSFLANIHETIGLSIANANELEKVTITSTPIIVMKTTIEIFPKKK